MIVRMAKVMLIGPKDQFLELLTTLQHLGSMHIESSPTTQTCTDIEHCHRALNVDEEVVRERIYLEKLDQQVQQLLSLLPSEAIRPSFISPETALQFVPQAYEQHEKRCAAWREKQELTGQKLSSLKKYRRFLHEVESLIPDQAGFEALDVVGIVVQDVKAFEELLEIIKKKLPGYVDSRFAEAKGAQHFGLIAVEREETKRLLDMLGGHKMSQLHCPEERFEALPFPEKIGAVDQRIADYESEWQVNNNALTGFARKWGGIYRNLETWVSERLAVIAASTSLFETERCFLVFGWMPVGEVEKLKKTIEKRFGGMVLIEEMEVLEHDLARVPIVLKNPGYFQAFELFSRLLPLPSYASFDITPFIAIFFPIFFGMMLGDIGYGLIVGLLALGVYRISSNQKNLNDAAKILFVAACYTVVFGLFYGEFFGDLGAEHFGLHPLFFERQTAIMPMLVFAVSLGVVHVVIGLFLSMLSALRQNQRREAIFRLCSILLILCVVGGAGLYATDTMGHLRKPIQGSLVGIIIVLMMTGGMLAPLEMLKHFGNIISYARIMAIGLTSVLLAEVANQLAGMVGSLWLGLLVALLLHTFNIMLGIFAPTIHALRLHYVEFFSKFMETSGKTFQPLEKKNKGESYGNRHHVG